MWLAIPAAAPSTVQAFRRVGPTETMWTNVSTDEAAGLASEQPDPDGSVTPDALHLAVHRTPPASSLIFEYARGAPGEPWVEVPGTMATVNAIGLTSNPHLSADGQELIFTGHDGTATWDLYSATRPGFGMPFDSPVRIEELRSEMDNTDPWLSVDRRRLYFSRTHAAAPLTEWGIFYAER